MEEFKRELSANELQEISGGMMMPLCNHPKISEYLGRAEIRFGEKVYLWRCAHCGAEVWCLNVPRTGGATGTW